MKAKPGRPKLAARDRRSVEITTQLTPVENHEVNAVLAKRGLPRGAWLHGLVVQELAREEKGC